MKDLKPTLSFLLFGLVFLFTLATGTPIKPNIAELEGNQVENQGFRYSLPHLSQPEPTSISMSIHISRSDAEADKLPRHTEAAAEAQINKGWGNFPWANFGVPPNKNDASYLGPITNARSVKAVVDKHDSQVTAAPKVLPHNFLNIIHPMATVAPKVEDKRDSNPSDTIIVRWNHQAFSSDLTIGEPIEIETINGKVVWLTGAFIRTDSVWEEPMTTTTTTHSRYHRPTTDLWPVITWSASGDIEYSDGVPYTTFHVVTRATDGSNHKSLKEHTWHPTQNTHTGLYPVETAIPTSFPNLSGTHGGPPLVTPRPSTTSKSPHTHGGHTPETIRPKVPRAADDLYEHSPPSTLNYTHPHGPPIETFTQTEPHTLSKTHWHGPPFIPTMTARVRPSPLAVVRNEVARCTTTAIQLMSPIQHGATKIVWTSTTKITAEVDCHGCSLTVWIPDSTKRFHFTKTKTLPGIFEFVTQGCRPSHTPLNPKDFGGSL